VRGPQLLKKVSAQWLFFNFY